MTTTLVINALIPESEESSAVRLDIFVAKKDFVGIYDQLEIWRSIDTQDGPYEELTAIELSQPKIPKDAEDPPDEPVLGYLKYLSGKELLFAVHGEELLVSISGTDPLHYGDVAAQVNAAYGTEVHAYVDAYGIFVLKSLAYGAGASIEILESDAAVLLGLPIARPNSLAYGKEARINLIETQIRYGFTDLSGSSSYFYKVRFRNKTIEVISEFSQSFSGSSKVGIDPSNLILGYMNLVQGNGKPMVNREVLIYTEFNGVVIGTSDVGGGKVLAGDDQVYKTDENGRVELTLIRGQKMSVAVPGTSIYRTFTVPTDPSLESFNLLDPLIADEDVFKARVPQIITAERRSL